MGAEVKSMDIKKNSSATVTEKERAVPAKQMQQFVTDVKDEIQKITWTNREELIIYTQIVVVATFLFGMAIYLWDLIIQAALAGLHGIVSLISG